MSNRSRLTANTSKEVTPYVLLEPVGIDIAITALQKKMAELEFIEKSFGRAVKQVNTHDDQDYFYPAVFAGEGVDWLDMLMNDNFDSYVYFIAEDPQQPLDYDGETLNTYTRNFSLIFWGNLNRIYSGIKYDFTEEIKQDIINQIKNTKKFYQHENGSSVSYIELVSIQDGHENIFKEFSFNRAKSQYLHYPYRGIRVNLKAYILDSCQ